MVSTAEQPILTRLSVLQRLYACSHRCEFDCSHNEEHLIRILFYFLVDLLMSGMSYIVQRYLFLCLTFGFYDQTNCQRDNLVLSKSYRKAYVHPSEYEVLMMC